MTTRKDRVVAEATQTHDYTETRKRRTRKTNNGTTAEVEIRTETSKANPGDNRRVVEIETEDGNQRVREHRGEEVTDDTMQERDDEIKARESRANHMQRKEKHGELGDERDDDDAESVKRFAAEHMDEKTDDRTEEDAIEWVKEQAEQVLEQDPIKTLRFIRGEHAMHELTH